MCLCHTSTTAPQEDGVELNTSQSYLIGEYIEDYRDQRLSRREMLARTLTAMGTVAGAAAALRQLGVSAHGVAAAAPLTVHATLAAADLHAAGLGEPGARTTPPLEMTSAFVVAEDDPAVVAGQVEFAGEASP